MIPELASLFLWFFGFVLLFAIAAVFMFADEMHEFQYATTGDPFEVPGAFDSMPQAFLRLIVLFSSENFPNLVLPAWASSKSSFLFFFTFTFIGTFFLRSIVLAYIVHIYMGVAKRQVAKERRKEWKGLIKAFNLLDHERKGFINYDIWASILSLLRSVKHPHPTTPTPTPTSAHTPTPTLTPTPTPAPAPAHAYTALETMTVCVHALMLLRAQH